MSSGTGLFIAQRGSAIVLALLGCWFAFSLAGLDSFTYLDAQQFVAQRMNAVLLSVLCIAAAFHSYLGIEVVIEDYVHAKGLRNFSLLLSRLAHLLVAVLAINAIVQIGIGS